MMCRLVDEGLIADRFVGKLHALWNRPSTYTIFEDLQMNEMPTVNIHI